MSINKKIERRKRDVVAPKRWVLRFRAKDRENFLQVKNGKKTIETRAATARYRDVKKGDVLVFACGTMKLPKKVKRVMHFPSVRSMIAAVGHKKIMPALKNPSVKDVEGVYHGYEGYKEKIREHGILAMWI